MPLKRIVIEKEAKDKKYDVKSRAPKISLIKPREIEKCMISKI